MNMSDSIHVFEYVTGGMGQAGVRR